MTQDDVSKTLSKLKAIMIQSMDLNQCYILMFQNIQAIILEASGKTDKHL